MKDWEAVQTFKSGVFPDVLAVNSVGAATQDGTEHVAEQINNGIFGWMQDLMEYASLIPDGIIEANGTSQIREAIQLGNAVGPGLYVQWGKFDDPSITGDRVLLLSGQGVLIANYINLVSVSYVGDGNNATAPFFYKADAADGLVRDIAGLYFILPESRDYLFPNGAVITTSSWHTSDGYGSSSTKIRKFLTEIVASDDVVVTVVNSATLGFLITANKDCTLSVHWAHGASNSNAQFGFSVNSNQLTTNILDIAVSDRLAWSNGIGANLLSSDTLAEYPLNSGDIIRLHTSGGNALASPAGENISIVAVETPKSAGTIFGITY